MINYTQLKFPDQLFEDNYSDKKITPKSLMECLSLRHFSQKPFGVIILKITLLSRPTASESQDLTTAFPVLLRGIYQLLQ